ncbi:MAG: glycoside hydrolase family 16 protein [Bacteroidota bacterium]
MKFKKICAHYGSSVFITKNLPFHKVTKTLGSTITLYLLLLILVGFGTSCKRQQSSAMATEDLRDVEKWTLIFEEDFDQDLGQWNAWNSGAFNEEIQLYRPEQLSLEKGILKINIKREAVSGAATISDPSIKDFEYVSGRIESKVQFGPSDQEGQNAYRFLARIKLPAGHGMWPAFWTYGDQWPTRGEIDILEAWGGRPNEYLTNLFFGTEEGININSGTDILHKMGMDLTSNFHIYEMIWQENNVRIYFDEKLIHTYMANDSNNIEHFFGKKHKVVLNTAVGGTFFKDRDSDKYVDSSTMEIDWVKVYKR